MADKTEVLVVDPSTKFRLMIRALLDPLPGMRVVSGVDNGFEVLKTVIEHRPDVILMNADLPLLDGLTTLHHIMLRTPVPVVIVHDRENGSIEVQSDAYRFGAVAVVYRPANYLEAEHGWARRLVDTLEAAAGIKVSPLDETPVEEHRETGEKYWSNRLLFCEECGGKNILTPRQLAFEEPPCVHCGDPIRATHVIRYRKFRALVAIMADADALCALLHLVIQFHHSLPAAYVILLENDDIDRIVDFLNIRSTLRVQRLRDRITVEGGCCYMGHADEFVRFSTATNQPTLLVGGEHVSEAEHPCTALFTTVALEMKEKCMGIILGKITPFAAAGMGAVELAGGKALHFEVGMDNNNRLLPGINQGGLEEMGRQVIEELDRMLRCGAQDTGPVLAEDVEDESVSPD